MGAGEPFNFVLEKPQDPFSSAIEVDDMRNGQALIKQLDELTNKFGLLVQIGFMRFIYEKSDFANKLGVNLANKLGEAIGRIDVAKQRHDVDEYIRAANEADPVFNQVLEKITQLGEDLGELLRRSSSDEAYF